jgi:20S proteasome alpha/beta subunit
MDSLGARTITKTFSAIGTANAGLLAICESVYKPDLTTNELFHLTKKILRLALQRDVLSGCNMRILILTRDGELLESSFVTEDA